MKIFGKGGVFFRFSCLYFGTKLKKALPRSVSVTFFSFHTNIFILPDRTGLTVQSDVMCDAELAGGRGKKCLPRLWFATDAENHKDAFTLANKTLTNKRNK